MSIQIPPGITLLKFTPDNLERHMRVGNKWVTTLRDKPLNIAHLYYIRGMGVYFCQCSIPIEVLKINNNDAYAEGFLNSGELIKEIRRIYGPIKKVFQSTLVKVEGIDAVSQKAMDGAFEDRHKLLTIQSKYKCFDCAACSKDSFGPICLSHGHYMDTADKPACIDFFKP